MGRDRGALRGAGVDAFELNFSCPHGLPERKMGAAMGQDPDILEEVCGWVMSRGEETGLGEDDAERHAHRRPEPRGACAAARQGVSAINTIRSVIGRESRHAAAGADRRRLHDAGRLFVARPCKPIALRMVMEIATMIRNEFPGRSLSGHRRHRERRRCGAVHSARRGHRAGLHRRDEVRLRMREADVRRTARLHGEAQVRDARRFQRQEPRLLHHARRPREAPERSARPRRRSAAAAARSEEESCEPIGEWSGDEFVKANPTRSRIGCDQHDGHYTDFRRIFKHPIHP